MDDNRIPPPSHLQQYSQSPVHSSPHHHHLNSMRYSASSERERWGSCFAILVLVFLRSSFSFFVFLIQPLRNLPGSTRFDAAGGDSCLVPAFFEC
uniref:Predicted protein n=1 Tax=Hordeum vulgare subsp. vulgare TaxID=112509 RepID=F2CSE9_HORVV|nr:predicted protein [Hordeum vulgare subsp. vulgare]